MKAETFTWIQFVLQFGWLVSVPVMMLTVRTLRRRWRLPLEVLAAWALLIVFALSYWDFSVAYAPTEDMRADLASRDDGPRSGAVLFGWVWAAPYVLLLEGLFAGVRAVARRTTS